MPEELKSKLLPCPVSWCQSVSIWSRRSFEHRWLECQTCGCRTRRHETEADAETEWNSRSPSKFERLAREVAEASWVYESTIPLRAKEDRSALIESARKLAAYLAEPSQKGKQE